MTEHRALRQSCRILVVEDDTTAADCMVDLLRFLGHDARAAYDGLQGIASAEEFLPDIMLIDLGLPTIDGYEAARRVRARPWGRRVVLAALTGRTGEDDVRRSKEAGFDHHLVKPVDIDELERRLVVFCARPTDTRRWDEEPRHRGERERNERRDRPERSPAPPPKTPRR